MMFAKTSILGVRFESRIDILNPKSLCSLLFVFLFASIAVFQPRRAESLGKFHAELSGFRATTVSDMPRVGDAQDVDTDTLVSRYIPDGSFTPGRIYIFEKNGRMDNILFFRLILPFKLWLAGAKITKSAGMPMVAFMGGGPLFRLEFTKDGHRGVIFNGGRREVHGTLREELIVAY